jgi:hypothetical protein
MGNGMRRVTAAALVFVGGTGCGSNDLEPIRPGPLLDAAGAALDAAGQMEAAIDGPRVTADASPGRCKRGIAATVAPSAAFVPTASSPGISWWYNWANKSPGGAAGIEFVPMLWGAGSLSQTLPAGAKYVLGFNEPNFKSQANLTAQQAAADWPMVEARAKAAGIPIASPGVNYCGSATNASQCTDPTVTDPYTYLRQFFAACSNCEIDYVAVHAYYCDVASLKTYLEGDADAGGTTPGFTQFGKPIWVTELSCDASHSVADQKAYMQAAVPYLENNPNVLRYAWFSASPIPNALLANSDGSLTDLGKTYVALAQNCP